MPAEIKHIDGRPFNDDEPTDKDSVKHVVEVRFEDEPEPETRWQKIRSFMFWLLFFGWLDS
jgi:hypothetical protein